MAQWDQNRTDTKYLPFEHPLRENSPNPSQPTAPEEQIQGVLERIVFENPENGFFVGRLRVKDTDLIVPFVTALAAVSPGETVRLTGQWVENRRFGRQFKASSVEIIEPSSREGIEKYLCSGLIPGIGKIYAKRLVEAFGEKTFQVISETPAKLKTVPGIGPKRAQQIETAWKAHRALQSIMVFLQSHGISTAHAFRIYKQYGDSAAAVVRNNPYQLARDITGIGFHKADIIARTMGIPPDAPSRITAGIMYALDHANENGHVFFTTQELRQTAAELLGLREESLIPVMSELAESRQIIVERDSWYLPPLYHAERGCADKIKRLLRSPFEPIAIHLDNALKWVEKNVRMSLSEEQREAVHMGINAKVLVITGGPGTGKTTVIRSLISIFQAKGVSFLLGAPTGRAAKRMEAATGYEAQTIHRMLDFSPVTGQFQRNSNNPLDSDLLIVDESSMVDIHLAYALLSALKPTARLILVGDVDQLPSVGPGNFLFDIIASDGIPVVRLHTVFRQAAQSGIIVNAHRINRGEMPLFNTDDFFLIERSEPQKALDTIVEVVAKRLPRKFNLDPIRDIQVLAPMRRGIAGVENINAALRTHLNPTPHCIPHCPFTVGDKVMQIKNNYTLDVYNGDIGIVSLIDPDAREVEVRFEDERRVLYPLDELDNLVPAYGITVHKSQGSEYPAVVLAFLSQQYMMLQRNVLYTAITRGKKLVVIVGSAKAIATAVRNKHVAQRNSNLSDRIRNIL